MPTTQVLFDVEEAIQAALRFHRQHPFYILREVGAVADLRDRVRAGPSLRAPADALPTHETEARKTRYRYAGPHLTVDRTQLEISVRNDAPCFQKSIDLVILRDQPTLKFGDFGPGDVLEQFRLEDVDVAVEVKTSQSSDPASRGSYVQDICALLRLKELSLRARPEDPAHGYFLLVDRNDPIYGEWITPKERMRWASDAPQEFLFKSKTHGSLRLPGLEACGLRLSIDEPTHTKVSVKCYVMDSTRTIPQPLYAFIANEGVPVALQHYVTRDERNAEGLSQEET